MQTESQVQIGGPVAVSEMKLPEPKNKRTIGELADAWEREWDDVLSVAGTDRYQAVSRTVNLMKEWSSAENRHFRNRHLQAVYYQTYSDKGRAKPDKFAFRLARLDPQERMEQIKTVTGDRFRFPIYVKDPAGEQGMQQEWREYTFNDLRDVVMRDDPADMYDEASQVRAHLQGDHVTLRKLAGLPDPEAVARRNVLHADAAARQSQSRLYDAQALTEEQQAASQAIQNKRSEIELGIEETTSGEKLMAITMQHQAAQSQAGLAAETAEVQREAVRETKDTMIKTAKTKALAEQEQALTVWRQSIDEKIKAETQMDASVAARAALLQQRHRFTLAWGQQGLREAAAKLDPADRVVMQRAYDLDALIAAKEDKSGVWKNIYHKVRWIAAVGMPITAVPAQVSLYLNARELKKLRDERIRLYDRDEQMGALLGGLIDDDTRSASERAFALQLSKEQLMADLENGTLSQEKAAAYIRRLDADTQRIAAETERKKIETEYMQKHGEPMPTKYVTDRTETKKTQPVEKTAEDLVTAHPPGKEDEVYTVPRADAEASDMVIIGPAEKAQ